jgi:hypothetical protein
MDLDSQTIFFIKTPLKGFWSVKVKNKSIFNGVLLLPKTPALCYKSRLQQFSPVRNKLERILPSINFVQAGLGVCH